MTTALMILMDVLQINFYFTLLAPSRVVELPLLTLIWRAAVARRVVEVPIEKWAPTRPKDPTVRVFVARCATRCLGQRGCCC